ncbi:MAG: hypothetical protein AAGD96_34720 [Chloroflexota bacterium]
MIADVNFQELKEKSTAEIRVVRELHDHLQPQFSKQRAIQFTVAGCVLSALSFGLMFWFAYAGEPIASVAVMLITLVVLSAIVAFFGYVVVLFCRQVLYLSPIIISHVRAVLRESGMLS